MHSEAYKVLGGINRVGLEDEKGQVSHTFVIGLLFFFEFLSSFRFYYFSLRVTCSRKQHLIPNSNHLVYSDCVCFLIFIHTDGAVEDGNVTAGKGEDDVKKEQGRKVKCLSCSILYSCKDSPLSFSTPMKKCI